MRQIFIKSVLSILLCIFLSQYSISQSILKHETNYFDVVQDFKDAFETIKKVDYFLKQVEDGKKPEVNFSVNWSDLVDSIYLRTILVKNSPAVADFNDFKYRVSLSDLMDCNKKDKNFSKLREFQSELENTILYELRRVNKYENDIKEFYSYYQVIDELSKLFIKYSEIPVYSSILPNEFLEIESNVKPAIGEFISQTQRQKNKLEKELNGIKIQVDNLRNNIKVLESSLCNLDGEYSGNLGHTENNNVPSEISILRISGKNAQIKLRWSSFYSVENVKVSDGIISFENTYTTSCTVTQYFTANISSDFKRISNLVRKQVQNCPGMPNLHGKVFYDHYPGTLIKK